MATDWAAVRARYPGAARGGYLDTACKGVASPGAVAAIEQFCALARACPSRSATDDTVDLLAWSERARAAAARLVGASPGEIALVESAQHGLATVARAMRLEPGDRIVATSLEFHGTLLPWWSLRDRGVEVVVVPARDGRVDEEELCAAIDARTRAVVVSSVQEVTGQLLDLTTLVTQCHLAGALLVVDGAQHVGAAPLDVSALPVDAVAVPGHKWLCSPFGMGFLYVRREALERLAPDLHGHMTMETPAGGWGTFLSDPARPAIADWRFVETAQRLESGGTGPFVAAAALAGAIEDLLDLGPRAVAERACALAARAAEGLARQGHLVVTPEDARGAIVVARTAATPEGEHAAAAALAAAGVAVSVRFAGGAGGLRISPHVYADDADVDRLLEVTGSL